MPGSNTGRFRLLQAPEDLCKLETSLWKFYPDSLQMINVVVLKQLDKFPDDVKISLYLYEESFDNPFLVCIQQPNVHSAYGVITWSPTTPTPEMVEAYDCLIDWEKCPCFSTNRNNFAPLLKELLDKRGNQSKYREGIPGAMYAINRNTQIPLDPPEIPTHLELAPLDSSLAPRILQSWKYAEPHSLEAVTACLSPGGLPSTGVFLKSTGELVSSALVSPLGTINILHTEEDHRQKGLGRLTLEGLSHSICSLHPHLTPAAEVEPWNSSSTRLFAKCGFTYVCDVMWYYYEK